MKKLIIIVLGLLFMSNVSSGLITVYFGTTYIGNHLELTFATDGYEMYALDLGDDYFTIDNMTLNMSGVSSTISVNVSDHNGGPTLLANTTVLRFNATYTGKVFFNYTGNNTNATYTVHDITNGNYVLSNENSDANGTVDFSITLAGKTDIRISLDGYYNETSIETVFLYPNGNGYINNGHTFGDSPSWKCVDEVTPDDNTTYVYFATGGGYVRDAYEITDHTTEAGTISNLTVHIRAMRTVDYGTMVQNLGSLVRLDTVYYEPSNWVNRDRLTVNYQNFSYLYENSPATGNPWTWDEIDSVQIGAIYQSGTPTSDIRITNIYASINYTAGPGSIVINTHTAEGVEEENATLVGNLSEDGGHATVTHRFEYGTTTSYGNNTAIAPITEDETKKVNVSSLLPGTIYHYRIVGWDMYGVKYNGSDNTFNTKPYHPTGLVVTVSGDGLSGFLEWNIGAGADKSVLLSKTTGYPTSIDDGTVLYNGSNNNYTDFPLEYGVSQYYRIWSWSNNKTSDSFSSTSIINLLAPQPPYNGNSDFTPSLSTVNFTWNRGNASDREIIVEKLTDGYPSSVTDGVEHQNSTELYYNLTINGSSGQFTVFSYNATTKLYSIGLNIPWGGLEINVYKENEPWIAIGNYTVFITNSDVSETYQNTSANNPLRLDVLEIPNGEDCTIQVSKQGYSTRSQILDLVGNDYLNLSFYLPPSGEGSPSDESDEDWYVAPDENASYHYIVKVKDEAGEPVADAFVQIEAYINTTEDYEIVYSDYTDSSGQIEVDLISDTNYYITISKDNYETLTDTWPPPEVNYYEDITKEYVLHYESADYDFDSFMDYVVFCSETEWIKANETLKIYFKDKSSETNSITFRIYESFNGTEVFNASYSFTDDNYIIIYVTGLNVSRNHIVSISSLDHDSLGNLSWINCTVNKLYTQDYSGADLESKMDEGAGDFIMGWVNFAILFGPFIIILIGLGYADPGLGIIVSGLYLSLVSYRINLTNEATVIAMIATILPLGIIVFIITHGKKTTGGKS